MLAWPVGAALADDAPPDKTAATEPGTNEVAQPAPSPEPVSAKKPRSYPSSRSIATNRRPDQPNYVKTMDKFVHDGEDWSWLEFGLQHRTRFEIRDDFFSAGGQSDERFLLQSRAYLGVRKILDPLRFGFEFQDSHRFDSELPDNTGDINEADLLQAFGELYFDDALGDDIPLSFRVGRMSFDAIDRRLFTRNRFRNTTNAFDGFRLRLGDEKSRWELDTFAFQPVARAEQRFDHADEERWIYGINGYWRGWSPYVTLEPYYFILDEDRDDPASSDRTLHTMGVHGFGLIGETGFDYDFDVAFQFGNQGRLDQHAFAGHAEVGYTFAHQWKPRVAAMFDYATGDRNPNDRVNERFDPLFGAGHNFYGHSDLFRWQNTINPALFISIRPTKRMRIESFYRAYWLASDKDAFGRAGLVDPTGRSSAFVGQEFDLRMRYKIIDWADLDMGYAYFIPGDFTRQAGNRVDDSDYFYVQLTFTL